jgi:PAS domain-containing protein
MINFKADGDKRLYMPDYAFPVLFQLVVFPSTVFAATESRNQSLLPMLVWVTLAVVVLVASLLVVKAVLQKKGRSQPQRLTGPDDYNRTLEALREASELNRKIISQSPVGISIYDETGQCVAANDAIGQIIGATR